MKPRYFAAPVDGRDWLSQNHASCPELWVGFYKKASGRASITWPESVNQALCFGWIDGIRKAIDGDRYVIRFTPRSAGSTWSAVNVKRVAALKKAGLMERAGLAAFARKTAAKSGIYAYEQQKAATLGQEYEKLFRERPDAWKYFSSQPPWYRRTSSHWVIRAKKEETRLRRLTALIADSARGRKIQPLTRKDAT